jgi:hypothetical protein
MARRTAVVAMVIVACGTLIRFSWIAVAEPSPTVSEPPPGAETDDVGAGTGGGVPTSEPGGNGDGGASSLGRKPAPRASDIGLEPLERQGSLTIAVTSPRVFSRIDGACDASDSRVQFLSDDGRTRFVVLTGDVVGASGEVTVDIEGADVTWVAAADSETSTAQADRTSAFYEGDFI